MPKKIEKIGEWKPIGEVVHYFDKIGVAVIKLSGGLKLGETIRIVGGKETDFEQAVDSIEIDREKIEEGTKNDEVGMKIKEKVREGYKVYKA
jgi:putative protease